MQIRCEAPGAWKVANWDRIPDCERMRHFNFWNLSPTNAFYFRQTAICMPPCQNLGFCLAPNVCECPDNFEGPQCQFAKTKPCLDKPPTPMNSRVVCNEKECISTCNRGFAFPGGSKKLTMVCDAGNWVQRQQPPGKFQKVPDCLRNCIICLIIAHQPRTIFLLLVIFFPATSHSRVRPTMRQRWPMPSQQLLRVSPGVSRAAVQLSYVLSIFNLFKFRSLS